jgi:hypothetical protein
MSILYCIYKNNKYKAKIHNGMIKLTTKKKTDGFDNYVDVLGNKHDDLFVKEIKPEEANMVYEEDIYIKYKGEYFQLFAGRMTESSLENNAFMIWTDSEMLAKKCNFKKREQFVFVVDIPKEQIEAVKIVKHPISIFEDGGETAVILEGNTLIKWFAELF